MTKPSPRTEELMALNRAISQTIIEGTLNGTEAAMVLAAVTSRLAFQACVAKETPLAEVEDTALGLVDALHNAVRNLVVDTVRDPAFGPGYERDMRGTLQ